MLTPAQQKKVFANALKIAKKNHNSNTNKDTDAFALKVAQRAYAAAIANYHDILGEVSLALESRVNNTDIMPPNARFQFQGNQREILVLEEQPQIRTFQVDDVNSTIAKKKSHASGSKIENAGYYDEHAFRVSLPYCIFIILAEYEFRRGQKRYSDATLYFYFRNSRLTSIDDVLLVSPFPNTYEFERVCMGDSFQNAIWKVGRENASLQTVADVTVDSFYNTMFEGDINEWRAGGRKKLKLDFKLTWDKWAALTQKNPLIAVNHNWRTGPKLKDLLERFNSEGVARQKQLQNLLKKIEKLR
jgi:hypothetical protein